MFKAHLSEDISGYLDDIFQNHSCRTEHNFARKQNFLTEHTGSLEEMRKLGLNVHKFLASLSARQSVICKLSHEKFFCSTSTFSRSKTL